MPFSIMILIVMTFSKTTLSITTISITTNSIMVLYVRLITNCAQHNIMLSVPSA